MNRIIWELAVRRIYRERIADRIIEGKRKTEAFEDETIRKVALDIKREAEDYETCVTS